MQLEGVEGRLVAGSVAVVVAAAVSEGGKQRKAV
jgi:hypothetical protein